MLTRFTRSTILACVACACTLTPTVPPVVAQDFGLPVILPPTPPLITADRPSTYTVNIAGRNVAFTVSLWRDFMPPVDGNSDTLRASVQASTRHPRGLPTNLVLDSIRVGQRREIWSTRLIHLRTFAHTPNLISASAFDGPRWEVGSRVNFVLIYRLGRHKFAVTLRNVPVNATY